MPALIAVVRRASRTVILDAAVRPGDKLGVEAGDEVHVLRVSTSGHCGEHAEDVARVMRASGWSVHLRDYEQPMSLRTLDVAMTTPDQVSEVADEMVASYLDPDGPRLVPVSHRMRRRRCDVCGKVSNPSGLGVHQRRSGHRGWTSGEPGAIASPEVSE